MIALEKVKELCPDCKIEMIIGKNSKYCPKCRLLQVSLNVKVGLKWEPIGEADGGAHLGKILFDVQPVEANHV